MSVRIAFRCPAEDRVIGVVVGESGALIDAQTIERCYEPEAGYTMAAQSVKDGVQLLCPRCSNPVVVRADDVDVYVVPGSLRIAKARG